MLHVPHAPLQESEPSHHQQLRTEQRLF